MRVMMMKGILPMLQLELSHRIAPVVLCQDAAGPSRAHGLPTGAFCLAAGCPPAAEIHAVLALHRASSQARMLGAGLSAEVLAALGRMAALACAAMAMALSHQSRRVSCRLCADAGTSSLLRCS